MDYETIESIPVELKNKHLRYEIVNATFCSPAKVGERGIGYKPCCGANAYGIAAVIESFKRRLEKFDIYVDNEKMLSDIESYFLMVWNG
jgi:hypothetical protein